MGKRRSSASAFPERRGLLAHRAHRLGRLLGRLRAAVITVIVDRRPHGYLRALVSAATVDRRMGLDTSGVVSRKGLGIEREEILHYEPSPWVSLRRVLTPDDVGPRDVFLDIGSGKGRVLHEAAHYPFERVIGVEISEQLNEVARRNFAEQRERLRSPVEVHTADATTFEIPADVTVVYLYNPVVGGLFESAIDNLVRSVDAHPRTVRLICRALAPNEQRALESTGRFRLVREVPAPRPTRKWARRAALRMYVLDPAVASRQQTARPPKRPSL